MSLSIFHNSNINYVVDRRSCYSSEVYENMEVVPLMISVYAFLYWNTENDTPVSFFSMFFYLQEI